MSCGFLCSVKLFIKTFSTLTPLIFLFVIAHFEFIISCSANMLLYKIFLSQQHKIF